MTMRPPGYRFARFSLVISCFLLVGTIAYVANYAIEKQVQQLEYNNVTSLWDHFFELGVFLFPWPVLLCLLSLSGLVWYGRKWLWGVVLFFVEWFVVGHYFLR